MKKNSDSDMAELMAKIQQQLVILEKKIDSLISQSQERKPFGRFDRFRHHEKREQGNSYSERRFTKAICAECHKECEVPFKPTGDRPVYCQDCFSRRKQGGSFRAVIDKGPSTEGDFTQRQHSDKRPRRRSQRLAARKTVSHRRKERA